uniref:EF-hand calcium binding domain 2 n=1 Tax=Serinus canaria TaxID=9135 RepID=A0A8C9NIA1_SERCA
MFLFADVLVAEIEKKITEAFEVFDRESNKTVDVRFIGCIVRSLGCFPTEAEVQELLTKIEVEEPGGFVHLGNFLPVMTKIYSFSLKALDENKCGYITKEDLVKHLTEEGEPFNLEEMEDMLAVALDPETDTLHYRDYRTKLVVDETKNFPFKVWDAFR